MLIDKNFWKNKKVLLTGHTGFKGGWLLVFLESLEANVLGVSLEAENKSFFTETNLQESSQGLFQDIRDLKKMLEIERKFEPEILVIHSTISPNTTTILQSKLKIPVIYSATRGVHKRMQYDLKRYTKFFAISNTAPKKQFAIREFNKIMKKSGIHTKQMSKPETLELGKIICDTSYLGWLINYAQLSNMIAIQHGVDFDEMWTFSDEIQKFLGNRPKMFPGFIGGHCVIPNLDLMHNQTLDLIKKINTKYEKSVKNSKSIHKKYKK